MQSIDLRSDTTSRPTPAMRAAMAGADVGDDVLGDDPTVSRLEERLAERFGKDAAVFVPSGTMANQIALRVHLKPGQWVMGDAASHVFRVEGASTAGLAGVAALPVAAERGQPTPEQLRAALPFQHTTMQIMKHYAPGLLVLENTHNSAGGTVWQPEALYAACAWARAEGMTLHCDGARLWNASVASGCSEAEFAAPFDTVSVCFSKGLGAPVGSALVGQRDLIADARRVRSQLGGGMRQVGILAAAADYALTHNFHRLEEDHANARALAEGLVGCRGIEVDPQGVETNIVRIAMTEGDAGAWVDRAEAAGVRMLPLGRQLVRAVTCLDVSSEDIARAVARLREI